RLRLAEEPDEPLAPAGAGHEAQIYLGLPEPRSLRSDPEIARQGQFEASSETMAVDRRDGRLGAIGEPEEDLLRATGGPPHLERLRDFREGGQVRPGAERPVSGADDHDASDRLVGLQFPESPIEVLEELRREGVQRVGAVDRDRRHVRRRILRDQEGALRHHLALPSVFVESLPGLGPEVPARHHLGWDRRGLRPGVIAEGRQHRVNAQLVGHRQRSIGKPARNRIAASIVSIAMPSVSWIHAASSKYGPRTRVVMNPGTSFFTTTTVLPRDLARSTAAVSVASLVVSARITSTRGMSIGGLKKCMPTTFSGRFVTDAMFVIRRADVFDAKIVFLGAASSSSWKTRFLRSTSSNTASIAMSAPRHAWARSSVT